MNLPFFIARRYLFARKSHNVINIISAISAVGMAVGTAALIIILSVYNGFDALVKSMLGNIEPDLLVTPVSGKTFVPGGEAYDWAYGQDAVENMCCVLEENVFISYEGHQCIATAKGVDSIYEEESPLRNHLREGVFRLHRGDVPMASVGAGLASSMGISPRFVAPIEIFYPSRTRNISLSNPVASLESVKVFPSSVFNINSDIDSRYLILPLETMQELLEERVPFITSCPANHHLCRKLLPAHLDTLESSENLVLDGGSYMPILARTCLRPPWRTGGRLIVRAAQG